MMRALVALLVASAVLAGCTESPAADGADGVDPASGPEPGAPSPSTPSPPGGTQSETPARPPNASAGDVANQTPETPDAPSGPPRAWPALEDATIRPGVQVYAGGSQCTSNFVFTSPDNATLYLGVAAHCFRGASLGDSVEIDGGGTGTLAYSSWIAMGSDGGDETTGANPTCTAEEDQRVCELNDFALVRISEASEPLVHPAMLHFGGPTALAPNAEVRVGDKVITYGNSGLRAGFDPSNRHEGYVLDHSEAWTTTTYTAAQGIPGDSGSGVMLGDGRAFGVLVTVTLYPTAGSNGVTSLDLALAYAKEKAGIDARLATWELLTPGALPAL